MDGVDVATRVATAKPSALGAGSCLPRSSGLSRAAGGDALSDFAGLVSAVPAFMARGVSQPAVTATVHRLGADMHGCGDEQVLGRARVETRIAARGPQRSATRDCRPEVS
jgi:hypothetical protein